MKADGIDASDEVFDDIDLTVEEDWAGFDEQGDCAVGVYEMKTQIIRS